MAAFRRGRVVEVTERLDDLVRLRVVAGDTEVSAVAFPSMTGPIAEGDLVVVNTTGIELGLGTGGVAFVLWDVDGPGPPGPGDGHIVKMRYTPWQTEVLAAEAPESPHHDALRDADSIEGMPVVACSLHSQVAGAVAGIKAARPGARVGYLMTDGAALPLAWSDLVRSLRAAGLVDVTATAGHAFGGDLEAVNVFSGLAALRHAAGADVAVVAMGPGVVGTSTRLGFTGIEQGQVLDAALALHGPAVASLRISFAEERDRHHGVSEHSLVALSIAATGRCLVAVPELPAPRDGLVSAQLERHGVAARHELVRLDGEPGIALLEENGLRPSSMGHSFEDVRELFLAAAAAGRLAAERAARRAAAPG